MACLRLATFLPLRPDLSVPFFIARISRSTDFEALGLYFRPLDFFAGDFLAADFLAAVFFAVVFFAALFFAALLFFVLAFLEADFLDGIRTFLHSHGKLMSLQKLCYCML